MNIISDIAGQFDSLMKLIKKMPDDEIILVGDIIDRGPKSRQVVEWAMKNSTTILANHEHMMVDSFLHSKGNFYEPMLWESHNGGINTILSYIPETEYGIGLAENILCGKDNWRKWIPKSHIKWMASNPICIEIDGLLISHANKHPYITIEQCKDLGSGFYRKTPGQDSDNSFLWNLVCPKKIKGMIQIFGHAAHEDYPKFYTDEFPLGIKEYKEDAFAIGIDCSFSRLLTGIHWPSRKIFQEPY